MCLIHTLYRLSLDDTDVLHVICNKRCWLNIETACSSLVIVLCAYFVIYTRCNHNIAD